MHSGFRFLAPLFLGLSGLALAATCTAQVNTSPIPDTAHSPIVPGARLAPIVPARAASIQRDYGNLPLRFEPNVGQIDPRVKFTSRGSGYSLFLTGSTAVLALNKADATGRSKDASRPSAAPGKTDVVRMELVGANGDIRVAGKDRLSGDANYFVGNSPAGWHSNIPTYAKVNLANVYDGIDLIYYGNQSQLEYDFVVAPGASPKPIRLRFAGVDRLSVNPSGDLSVIAGSGKVVFQRPVVYQEIHGLRQPIQGRFTLLAKNSVGFTLGNYDHTQPLVIDPILSYSTYVGGASGSGISAIAVDAAGNAYVTGTTGSMSYPVTAGALQPAYPDLYGNPTVFVAKLNAKGTALVYSTYLGGTGQPFEGLNFPGDDEESCGASTAGVGFYSSCGDYAGTIAVDPSGNAFVTGQTFSSDFPLTPGAFQSTNYAAPSNPTIFVTKLNPSGSALVYSTYLGGSGGGNGGGDWPTAIALDSSGDAFVAGYAFSGDFPVTPGAAQSYNHAQAQETNGFVSKLNATGTALLASTFLGGYGYGFPWYDPGATQLVADGAAGVAVDLEGNAYVSGTTFGGFPVTSGAFETNFGGGDCVDGNCYQSSAGFLSKLNPTFTTLTYSTYLTGPSDTGAYAGGVAVDGSGSAWVTGGADWDYPVTPGAYQTTGPGAFITKMTPDGSAQIYSTFFPVGGNLALDAAGDVYLAGGAGSGLPVTSGAIQPQLNGTSDAFLSELDPTLSTLLFSTYLGGSGGAGASGLALGADGDVYLAGSAGVNFPVTPGALQTGISGTGDGFVAKLNLASPITLIETTTTLTAGANPQPSGMPDTFTATVVGNGGNSAPTGYVYFSVDGVYAARRTLNPAGSAVYTTSSLAVGTHNVEALYAGNSTFSFSNDTVSDSVIATATPTISPSGGKYVAAVAVSLSDPTPGATIYYTVNGGAPSLSSTVYTGPITITSGYAVIRAFATVNGYSPTPIVESAYSILAQTPAPTLSPGSSNVPLGQLVTIADAEPTATLRFTTDGSTPTTTSNWYHGPIAVTGPETINAIAVSTGQASSEVASAAYTVYTQAPTFSPAPGKYVGTTPLTLSDISPAPYATIHYTLDNSNPTASSPKYTGPIDLPTGYTVVKAIAIFTNGYPPSSIVQAAYSVLPQTPPPTFSPGAGTYAPGQTVTLADSISTATIRYTTDGSTPTTKSPVYSKPIPLSGTETIQAIAIAIAQGEAASNPVSATYTPQ